MKLIFSTHPYFDSYGRNTGKRQMGVTLVSFVFRKYPCSAHAPEGDNIELGRNISQFVFFSSHMNMIHCIVATDQ